MLIANPIYDTVFKYLMFDLEIAKGVITTIVDEEIASLDFKTSENKSKKDIFQSFEPDKKELVYRRLDFIAKIKQPDGKFQHILIKLRKTNILYDIIQFSTSPGEKNKKKDEVVTETGKEKTRSLPVITIYFLGFFLSRSLPAVLKVNREYFDVFTGEKINERNYFIEELPHDAYIIQIPGLRVEPKNRLECVLSVFQQENFIGGNHRLKNFAYETDDELTVKMLKQLEKAAADGELYRQLELEELAQSEYENAFGELEERLEKQGKILVEKEQALEQKDRQLEQKEKQIRELMEKLKTQG